jgi:F-type H+-transporting ATPase subunit delta
MIAGRLSRRYARAIFELAREEHKEEVVQEEIDRFVDAYNKPDLNTVLNNPAFGLESRKSVVAKVAEHLRLTPLSVRFLSLLMERDRLAYLPSIALHYHGLLDETKGRVEAQIAAPAPLGDAVLEKMRDALQKVCGKEVILRENVDPGLIGGVLIELEGKIYDGSIRTQLENMKESIERGY